MIRLDLSGLTSPPTRLMLPIMLANQKIAELPIPIDREKIAAFCRERGIRKLSLFGSLLREDFDPARSDVDVLVEFFPGAKPGWEFFRWGDDLAKIIGQKVDLCSRLNPYIEEEVRREALIIYEQT